MSIELNSRNSRERLQTNISNTIQTFDNTHAHDFDHGTGHTSPDPDYENEIQEDTLKSRLKIKDSYFLEDQIKDEKDNYDVSGFRIDVKQKMREIKNVLSTKKNTMMIQEDKIE